MDHKTEVIMVPTIGLSHLTSTIEFAKLLINHDHRFSITILLIPAPFILTPHTYIESVTNSVNRIRFINLPSSNQPLPDTEPGLPFLSLFLENHKPQVKLAISQLITDSVQIVGLVIDMFTTSMIDVANEFNIPSYLYFTSNLAVLGFMLHLPYLDEEIKTELRDYSGELSLPSYVNSVPILALPLFLLSKKSGGYAWFLYHARRFRETKVIIVNSVAELEPKAIDFFNDERNQVPPVYAVGPVLDLNNSGPDEKNSDRILKWLDDQPVSSVIFLCFGSRGSFHEPQVKEIAVGLEKSGHRFLWSLRKPPTAKFTLTSDYENPDEVLPEGFLERTAERGLICGWAPQVEVLAHKAIGGFVSHCGWNSILESLWFGVPILTWPIDAEQKLNAFEMVKDLGLAVAIKEGYVDGDDFMMAEEIEKGVKCVMDGDSEVRRKVKEMREVCRKAVMDGGSSSSSIRRLVDDLTKGI